MTKIDDLGRVLVCDQAIEQCHLAVDVANSRDFGFFGQKLRQRPVAGIEIECRDRTVLLQMEICKQPRQQGFANAWTWRGDNGDGAAE